MKLALSDWSRFPMGGSAGGPAWLLARRCPQGALRTCADAHQG